MKLLIIEDEYGLREAIKESLIKEGYLVDAVEDGKTGLEMALLDQYDLILLDIMLPKLDGIQILKEVRNKKIKTPIIMVTAKSELDDKINGLDSGADDYLTKPFEILELLARIRTVTRRKDDRIDFNLYFGDIVLNTRSFLLLCTETKKEVVLGMKEYQILELLMRNASQIMSREQITERVWGYDSNSEYNNVDVYISFIRKKINYIGAKIKIKSIRSVGYELEE